MVCGPMVSYEERLRLTNMLLLIALEAKVLMPLNGEIEQSQKLCPCAAGQSQTVMSELKKRRFKTSLMSVRRTY